MAAADATSPDTISICICGASGRIGRRLLALADADEALRVAGAIVSESSSALGTTVGVLAPDADASREMLLTDSIPDAEVSVMVDFSTPAATLARAAQAASRGIALVVGTTGMSEAEEAVLREASEKVPVILAHNFSLGVNLLCRVAAEVARALGDDFDAEIVEAHHNRKVDSPSGTALGIARAVAAALGRDIATDLRCGREGRASKRGKREIGMHSLRMGNVVGEHTAHFASDFERIELTHRAQSRDVFAAGALRAAKWVAGKAPGWYTMDDVLFGGSA